MPYIFFSKIKRYLEGKVDIVIVYSPPLTLATVGKLVRNKYGSKFILNVQDIFPQNAIDLGIIKNYMLLVRRAMGRNIEASGYADIVGQEIDRIANIVRELLDFYRPVRDELVPIDVGTVMDNVLLLMDRQFKKLSIELFSESICKGYKINGSADNLKQVFLNIIINACDAMPSGGKLRVKIRIEGDEMIITFCDTGLGIKPENIPRIFEPFYTTKEPGKGTGLGLSVCYGIIKRHGGSITYKNTDDGGCFEIKLPVSGNRISNE